MLRLAATSLAYGLIGLILTPIVVFLLVIVLAYTFDPRCGSPGDPAAAKWVLPRSPSCRSFRAS